MSRVHVIGAGLAGLSAAIAATEAGRAVTLYEATAAGGGRCRSYFDTELGMRLDNGNHLLLSGNTSAFAYIDKTGARDRFTGPRDPIFPFMDLKTGRQWTLRPNRGRIPWWVLSARRRVPRTGVGEHLDIRKLGRAWDDTVITETMRHSQLYWLLLEPLSVAALNTRPHEALACLFGAVLRETLLKGGKACLPRVPKEGLSEALVDPAVSTLRERGGEILFNRRITGLLVEQGRVTALGTPEGQVTIGPDEAVVLAVPPWVAGELLPEITVPNAFESILNVHFKVAVTPAPDVAEAGFIGIVNGTAEWIFIRPDRVSVTVSAANKLIDRPAGDLALAVWRDVAKALGPDGTEATEVPPFRVIKERRATIVANVAQEERRPGAQTDMANLVLAGDWTDTRLPGTIEGAIRSGVTAVAMLLSPPDALPRRGKRKRMAARDG
jgi:squalene-associated FAD-dependent desaturase